MLAEQAFNIGHIEGIRYFRVKAARHAKTGALKLQAPPFSRRPLATSEKYHEVEDCKAMAFDPRFVGIDVGVTRVCWCSACSPLLKGLQRRWKKPCKMHEFVSNKNNPANKNQHGEFTAGKNRLNRIL